MAIDLLVNDVPLLEQRTKINNNDLFLDGLITALQQFAMGDKSEGVLYFQDKDNPQEGDYKIDGNDGLKVYQYQSTVWTFVGSINDGKIFGDYVNENPVTPETLVNGVASDFTVDGVARKYENPTGCGCWSVSENKIVPLVLNQAFLVTTKFTVESAQPSKTVVLEGYIPERLTDPTHPEIVVKRITYQVAEQNIEYPFDNTYALYAGPEALLEGIKFRLTANNNMTLTDKSIQVIKV